MTEEPWVDLNQPVGDRVAKTTCYMCACRCGIDVHIRDGKLRYIEGNRDHPVNKGVLCGKGSAGIMQHDSPARLRAPLKRVGPRGSGEFEEISWDEALELATGWLGAVRKSDPKRLAFFTGRDQSQSLTGFWAMQFGTPNFAAHGGFCSISPRAARPRLSTGAWTFRSAACGERSATTPRTRRSSRPCGAAATSSPRRSPVNEAAAAQEPSADPDQTRSRLAGSRALTF